MSCKVLIWTMQKFLWEDNLSGLLSHLWLRSYQQPPQNFALFLKPSVIFVKKPNKTCFIQPQTICFKMVNFNRILRTKTQKNQLHCAYKSVFVRHQKHWWYLGFSSWVNKSSVKKQQQTIDGDGDNIGFNVLVMLILTKANEKQQDIAVCPPAPGFQYKNRHNNGLMHTMSIIY